eukprot:160692-Amphidinium_carterae.1
MHRKLRTRIEHKHWAERESQDSARPTNLTAYFASPILFGVMGGTGAVWGFTKLAVSKPFSFSSQSQLLFGGTSSSKYFKARSPSNSELPHVPIMPETYAIACDWKTMIFLLSCGCTWLLRSLPFEGCVACSQQFPCQGLELTALLHNPNERASLLSNKRSCTALTHCWLLTV